jgi:glycosyltransferase involved in cell wall biosynthesis
VRVLLTVHQFLPDYKSGTEVLTFSVAQDLRRRGHGVLVFTGYPDPAPLADEARLDRYTVDGIDVVRFHHAHVPMGGETVLTRQEYRNKLAAGYFARTVREFAPDVIHFFHLSRLSGLLVDAALDAGIPAYYTPTDFWSICQTAQLMLPGGGPCGGPTADAGNCVKHMAELTQGRAVGALAGRVPDALADTVVRLTAQGLLPPYPMHREVAAVHGRMDFLIRRLNWLHGIAAPTAVMADTLLRHGVDADLIVRMGYGIDTTGIAPTPVAHTPGTPLVAAFIGTLAPHKGSRVAIEAVRRLAPGTVRLMIYGNPNDFPDYYASLQHQAADSPDIVFCGTFPPNRIGSVLSECHVLVIPSLWFENAPLVMHNALAAKRPVIASDLPGLAETVKAGENGLLFPAGDARRLAALFTSLHQNPSLLSALSAGCRAPKSIATYVDEVLSLYARGPLRGMEKRDYHGRENIAPFAAVER